MARDFSAYERIKNEQRITSAQVGDKFRKSDGTILRITYAYHGDLCALFLNPQGEWDGTQSVREYELLAYLNENNFERIA